ncbi:GNAT family N-acetyltransferase [Halovulum dunhuangense]|uniref:GNAT family N-acetyltransferase n=1 Tax=Halovulum dunhuangense TaxID=1505036 RepID=A0A849L1S8_9RHOB|nr:GNAT family N-acetyltransferase [Halovulum dunhuangense]NNU80268.1 GNAT family N-acetyltransferase [Halovulum dunhuangense]
MSDLHIRPPAPDHAPDWRRLWRGCLAFHRTQVPGQVCATTLARLLSGAKGAFRGRIARRGDAAVGLVQFLFHRHCWRMENVVYPQDLYVAPRARGIGLGRALCGRVARLTPFLKYQRPAQ